MEAARAATADDLPALRQLEEEARALAAPERGGALHLGHHAARGEAFADLLDDGDAVVLVGTIDDVPVGYAVASRVVLADGSALALLTDLFVLPGARGVGVGHELLEGVLAWATATGCTGVESTALPGDRSTKNFFEAHGMVAQALRVHRTLEGDAS